jgi:hypothetical protein
MFSALPPSSQKVIHPRHNLNAEKTFGNESIPLDAGLRGTPETDPLDAERQRLLEAWPMLPAVLRSGILAMIDAARKDG